MAEQSYAYVVVGAGLAGASAVEGIREIDSVGRILLIGSEPELPYNRPPLSKQLWSGKKKVQDIFVHDRAFYEQKGVELALDTRVNAVDRSAQAVTGDRGRGWRYEKLLLATGGSPRRLAIPGGDLQGLCYYRTLADYHQARAAANAGASALVIGGGFIGSETAAALCGVGAQVTMLFPGQHLVERIFPASLALAIDEVYRKKGVTVLSGDAPTAIECAGARFRTRTRAGRSIESDLVVIGIGIAPEIELAQAAGLRVANGIEVNDRLRSSDERIFAAGDNALFPYLALGKATRVEHWDQAQNSGRSAGRNMAGANEPYTHMPYFFSDLFEFGYEAVGEIDSRLNTFADWQKENDTGAIYYLKDGLTRGVMLCNIWGKVDAARELVRSLARVSETDLRGRIR